MDAMGDGGAIAGAIGPILAAPKVVGGVGAIVDEIGVGAKATSKVIAEYGPMNQGPLPNGIADTFRSGTYSEVVTQLLQVYQAQLIAEIGHDDWARATQEEFSLETVAAKWGSSKGWRLYCVRDLVGACENALVEMEPVCIAFS